MAWIESHADLRDHPKLDHLIELTGLTRRDAAGMLHFIWWRALKYAPSGDLSPFTDGQVARWADWEGDPAMLVDALIGAGFLSDGRQLHDWYDYAGKWVERREANAARMREAREKHVQRTSQTRVELPDLTGPNLTGPETPPPTPSPQAGQGGAADAAAKKPRRDRRNGIPSDDGEPRAEAEPAPVTPRDREVWNLARADLAPRLAPGNAEMIERLEPIGRAPDGGLRLRAPPGAWKPERFRGQVARALLDAGDQAAANVSIVDG